MKKHNILGIVLCSAAIFSLSVFLYLIFIGEINNSYTHLFGGIMLLGIGMEDLFNNYIENKSSSPDIDLDNQMDYFLYTSKAKSLDITTFIISISVFIIITMQFFNFYFSGQNWILFTLLCIWIISKSIKITCYLNTLKKY